MVTVTNNNIRAAMYENIYDELVAANLLSSTASVYSAYPDNNPSFPLVIVNPVDVSGEEFSFDRSNHRRNIAVVIDIYTKKNKDKDLLADAIHSLLDDKKFSGVSLIGYTESNAFEAPGGSKVHLKSITYSYMRA